MSEIKIVPISSTQDLMEISELADVIWHQHFTPIIGAKQVDYMLENFQSYSAMRDQVDNQGYEYCFLNYDGKNVGYVAFTREDEAIFLSKIYILETYRGKKIGREAIQYIKEFGKKAQCTKVRLTVNRRNLNTIMAYNAMGFTISSEEKKSIGDGFVMDDYIMELEIS